MAKTIQEIQDMITDKYDAREVINEIADYLQAIPVGGGNTIYTGDDALTGNRIVNLDGKTLSFNQGSNSFLSIDPTVNAESIQLQSYNTTDGRNFAGVAGSTSDTYADMAIFATFDAGQAGQKIAQIEAYVDATTATITLAAADGVGVNMTTDSHSPFGVAALPAYANNAAATGAGLTSGMFYRISAAGTSAVAVVE